VQVATTVIERIHDSYTKKQNPAQVAEPEAGRGGGGERGEGLGATKPQQQAAALGTIGIRGAAGRFG